MGNASSNNSDTASDMVQRARDVKLMDRQIQQRFRSGVNYNMKVLVRGDRATGKAALLHRLQGNQMPDQYTPTNEIKIATINWSPAAEVVKVRDAPAVTSAKLTESHCQVELWDVVDKGTLKEDCIISPDEPAGATKKDLKKKKKKEKKGWDKTKGTRGSVTVGALDATTVDVYNGERSKERLLPAQRLRTAHAPLIRRSPL